MAIIIRRYSHTGPATAKIQQFANSLSAVVATYPRVVLDISIDDAIAGNIQTLDDFLAQYGLTPDTGAPEGLVSKPNILRNSGFWFAQKQAPGTLTSVGSTIIRSFGPDGWGVTNENANTQYVRIDTEAAPEAGLSGRYYGRWVKITNAGKIAVTQAIESRDMQYVRGKTVRLQVMLKSVVAAATYRLGLLQLTSAGTVDVVPAINSGSWISAWNGAGVDPTLTAGNNTAYIAPNASGVDNTVVDGNALDCPVTTTWQRFGGTFTVPTDCKNLIVQIWSDAQAPINDGIQIAEASLSEGSEIVAWAPLPWTDELNRCRRFTVKTFSIDTAPAQNAGETGGSLHGITGKTGASTSALFMYWRFPVPLFREGLDNSGAGAPLGITTYNPAALNALPRNITVGIDMASFSSTIVARREGVRIQATGVGGGGGSTVGDDCQLHLLIFGEL